MLSPLCPVTARCSLSRCCSADGSLWPSAAGSRVARGTPLSIACARSPCGSARSVRATCLLPLPATARALAARLHRPPTSALPSPQRTRVLLPLALPDLRSQHMAKSTPRSRVHEMSALRWPQDLGPTRQAVASPQQPSRKTACLTCHARPSVPRAAILPSPPSIPHYLCRVRALRRADGEPRANAPSAPAFRPPSSLAVLAPSKRIGTAHVVCRESVDHSSTDHTTRGVAAASQTEPESSHQAGKRVRLGCRWRGRWRWRRRRERRQAG